MFCPINLKVLLCNFQKDCAKTSAWVQVAVKEYSNIPYENEEFMSLISLWIAPVTSGERPGFVGMGRKIFLLHKILGFQCRRLNYYFISLLPNKQFNLL